MHPVSREAAAALREKSYNAAVTRVFECHRELRIVRVRPDAGAIVFRPGQYTTLGLGAWEARVPAFDKELIRRGQERKLILRAYSISHPILDDDTGDLADPDRLDFNEFYVSLLTGSREGDDLPHLTPRLFRIQEGDRIFVGRKITGRYTLDGLAPGEDVVLAGTGTGEAPHNAMVWHLLRSGHRGRIASVICTRLAADQGYRDRHLLLQKRHDNYTYVAITTREPGDAGRKIYLQELFGEGILEERLGWRIDPARAHVFLCGNPSMIGIPKVTRGKRVYPEPAGLIELLEKRGFNAGGRPGERLNVHFEKYW